MASMAMREVEHINREIKRLLKEIQEQIWKIENDMNNHASQLPQQVKKKMEHCKSQIKTMDLERQTIENREFGKKFRQVIYDHRTKLEELER
eukprot:204083_1